MTPASSALSLRRSSLLPPVSLIPSAGPAAATRSRTVLRRSRRSCGARTSSCLDRRPYTEACRPLLTIDRLDRAAQRRGRDRLPALFRIRVTRPATRMWTSMMIAALAAHESARAVEEDLVRRSLIGRGRPGLGRRPTPVGKRVIEQAWTCRESNEPVRRRRDRAPCRAGRCESREISS